MNIGEVILKSNEKEKSIVKSMILILSFTIAMIVSSHIKIGIFPVPFTMQTFVVVLSCFVIANKKACISYIIYLLYGLAGATVFANGGGVGYIFSPTFGYIIGFIVMAYVIGFMMEKQGKTKITLTKLILFGFIGVAIQLTMGTSYLYLISSTVLKTNPSLLSTIVNGFVIFIPYDMIKVIVAGLITKQIKDIK